MTLVELVEPYFEYICRLNRTARKGGDAQEAAVRSEVLRLLADMKTKSQAEGKLQENFLKVELPLIFFVDSMISESRLKFAQRWNSNRLAFDRKELAGDEKFFDMLDETLQDASSDATERLQVYYTCLGLGFSGWYAGQSDYLARKMKEIAARIGVNTSPEAKGKIVPEAYEKVDTRDLVQPPAAALTGVLIVLASLIGLLLFLNVMIYRQQSRELAQSLHTIGNIGKVLKGEPIPEEEAEAAEAAAAGEEVDEEAPPVKKKPAAKGSAAARRAAEEE